MDAFRPVAATALLLALLLTGCTPPPPVSTGPPPCNAWDYVDRCDGWVRPVTNGFYRMDRRPAAGRYDLYLDPDGYYEKVVGDVLVGTGEFWIACAGTGDCRDDELLFLSSTGIEWELWVSELTCSPPYDDSYDLQPPRPPLPTFPSPSPPPTLPGKETPEPEFKEPSRRERGTETPPVRSKEVRRSEREQETPEPRPAPRDTTRSKEPRSKGRSTGGGR
ncbi:hypothetical protein KDK88_05005 [bacterium]|nr:hypothetical protein [bacterium]